MTSWEVSIEVVGGQTGRDAFLAAVAEGGGDSQLLTDCWLRDERRILCICPADVFCSNTARALNVRLEITACASCKHKKTLFQLTHSYAYGGKCSECPGTLYVEEQWFTSLRCLLRISLRVLCVSSLSVSSVSSTLLASFLLSSASLSAFRNWLMLLVCSLNLSSRTAASLNCHIINRI